MSVSHKMFAPLNDRPLLDLPILNRGLCNVQEMEMFFNSDL